MLAYWSEWQNFQWFQLKYSFTFYFSTAFTKKKSNIIGFVSQKNDQKS